MGDLFWYLSQKYRDARQQRADIDKTESETNLIDEKAQSESVDRFWREKTADAEVRYRNSQTYLQYLQAKELQARNALERSKFEEEQALKRYEHEMDRYILGQQLRIVNQAMSEGADITFRDVRISNRRLPEQAALPSAPPTLQASISIITELVEENKSLPLNKKKWLLGYTDDGPKVGTLYDLRSCGFGGSQGQGKTSTMVYHAYQAAANGCKLIGPIHW